MKSKGAIRLFTIALSLVCLYYISFSAVTYFAEKGAKDYANGDVAKERKYLDSLETEEIYNIGIAKFTYAECRSQELNLGLDLQGGMHITLEVAVDKLIKQLSGNPTDELLNQALLKADEKQKTRQEDYIDLFYESYLEVSDNGSLFRAFDTRDNRGKFDRDAADKDAEVLAYIKKEAESAIERTSDILRSRIDKFGVTQPNIVQEATGRISIELPGVEDADRIRKLLKSTAKLEFWETYETQEIVNFFESVNEVLVAKLDLDPVTATDAKTDDAASLLNEPIADANNLLETANDNDTTKIDSTSDDLTSELANSDNPLLTDNDSTKIDTANKEGQLNEEEFKKKYPLYAILQLPVSQDGQVYPGPVAGFAASADTQKVNTYLNYPEVKDVLPSDIKFMWEVKPIEDGSKVFRLIALKASGDNRPVLTGEVLTDALVDFDPYSGEPAVSMNMNTEGARIWKNVTGKNKGRSIAIALDGAIYSFPTVNGEIAGGRSSISGNFDIKEAKDLANILKAGKLPISVDIVEEAVVGPTLGAESIKNGLSSLIIGFILVLGFMAFYYGTAGWIANIAMLANLFFIVGVLSSLSAALTLPGMAGIVLTIGMSVDANVLIFERIREELKFGKSLRQAITDGYDNAKSSILDANLTTLLTGFILLAFGKGPISGFAIILVIGIITSLFSAIFLTRLMFERQLDKEKKITFGNAKTISAFENFNFDFISKSKVAFIASGVLILAGLVSLFTNGLNLSVDFEGGRSYIVKYDEAAGVTQVRNELTTVFGSAPVVKTFGDAKTHKITTKYRIDEEGETIDQQVQETLETGLKTALGSNGYTILESQKVGPTFARDIRDAAVYSIIFGLLVIFIYIVVRFRRWQYGLGALIALFHDVLVVLGIFSLLWKIAPFNLEVDQAFIAAILTVVGYSINDTVVVFDRIRESLGLHKKAELSLTVNNALNKTVSRTLITSLTTLLVIIVLFAIGGEIIRGFSFALLIGVLVGTYSSIFIASPIVAGLTKRKESTQE